MPKSDMFAAQVVLLGAPDDPAEATAKRVGSRPRDAKAAADAKRSFTAKGFKTGPVSGFSFSIEGSAKLFRDTFGVDLVYGPDGSVRRKGRGGGERVETLPTGKLPDAIRANVKSVLFSSPPAFGPGVLP